MAKGKLALGLDIGSTSVKMILLKEQRKRGQVSYALQSFGMKPLPPEAIVDGALMNSTAIVQALQENEQIVSIMQQADVRERLIARTEARLLQPGMRRRRRSLPPDMRSTQSSLASEETSRRHRIARAASGCGQRNRIRWPIQGRLFSTATPFLTFRKIFSFSVSGICQCGDQVARNAFAHCRSAPYSEAITPLLVKRHLLNQGERK